MGKLKGKKTYVAGALGVIGAVASYYTGDASLLEASQMALTAILGMTVRNAIP